MNALGQDDNRTSVKVCLTCCHDSGWLGSTTKTCQKPIGGPRSGEINACGCECKYSTGESKVIATIKQTNPGILMLPVLHNGELIGRMSLCREAVPTDKPFHFSIGYRIEEDKLAVYEVNLVEGG